MDFKVFAFGVLIETLMFIEIQSDTKCKCLAEESRKTVESVGGICDQFFNITDLKNDELKIVEELQEQNWEK